MKKFQADPFPTTTPSSYPTPAMRELFQAILKLKKVDEAAKFFRDLLTMSEIREFSQRWQTVKLLAQGNSYLAIADKLKTSTRTITRTAHWFFSGFGGYRLIADRIFGHTFKDKHTASYFTSGKSRGLKNPRSL